MDRSVEHEMGIGFMKTLSQRFRDLSMHRQQCMATRAIAMKMQMIQE